MKQKRNKRQKILFFAGLLLFTAGFGILSFLGIRKIRRDLHRQKLMKENTVIEIPALRIKAPVLEGVEQSVLKEAAPVRSAAETTASPVTAACCIRNTSTTSNRQNPAWKSGSLTTPAQKLCMRSQKCSSSIRMKRRSSMISGTAASHSSPARMTARSAASSSESRKNNPVSAITICMNKRAHLLQGCVRFCFRTDTKCS